jgi:hypothetical protein
MFQVLSLVVLLGLTLCMFPLHNTMAQQFSESDVVYEAARNKIGLIRYCRDNQLLKPEVADQVVAAVEAELSKISPDNSFVKEQGDRAQQAGEDGFWEAGRRRYIASVATLFRTTPADLCQEWADETLRAQTLRRRKEVATIDVVTPIQPIEPIQPPRQVAPTPVKTIIVKTVPVKTSPFEALQGKTAPLELIQLDTVAVELPPVEPIQADKSPPRATPVVKAARVALLPPLPERAPLPPPEPQAQAEPQPEPPVASLPATLPTGGFLASISRAVSGNKSGATATTPSAIQQPSEQAVPVSARQANETAAPLPREQAVTAADEPAPRIYDQPQPLVEKWPFKRVRKAERCLLAGCKWPAAQERRSWGY